MCDATVIREYLDMRIGSSIALVAVGLILALAVNIPVKGLDLHQIGWILVFVGLVGLVISLVLMRRSRPVIARESYPPAVREEVVPERPVAGETYPPVVGQEVAPPPPVVRRDPRYQDPNSL